jgi:hypothetical protein
MGNFNWIHFVTLSFRPDEMDSHLPPHSLARSVWAELWFVYHLRRLNN